MWKQSALLALLALVATEAIDLGERMPAVEVHSGFVNPINIWDRVKDKRVILVGLPGDFVHGRRLSVSPGGQNRRCAVPIKVTDPG